MLKTRLKVIKEGAVPAGSQRPCPKMGLEVLNPTTMTKKNNSYTLLQNISKEYLWAGRLRAPELKKRKEEISA